MKTALQTLPTPNSIPDHTCGWLEVDLGQVAENYHILKSHLQTASCSAVVKANAYGLGLEPIAHRLHQQGCKQFFVAHLDEAIQLRKTLPNATIFVLTGCLTNTEQEFKQHQLTPALNDMGMVERWAHLAKAHNSQLPALLHIDTGMHRIGFDEHNLEKLCENLDIIQSLELQGIMSHLACSPDPRHPQNEMQRQRFDQLCKLLPSAPRSLADTAGIYLGNTYHYDFVRPGKGLFGLFQSPTGPTLKQAFTLRARIIQVQSAKQGDTVGYGAQKSLTRDSRLATLSIGYGDGLDRRGATQGHVLIANHQAPIIGSLSMDYTVVDVTDIPADSINQGDWAVITRPDLPLETMAKNLGTISRELSTRMGNRLFRTTIN